MVTVLALCQSESPIQGTAGHFGIAVGGIRYSSVQHPGMH